jgi:hypothetical protein
LPSTHAQIGISAYVMSAATYSIGRLASTDPGFKRATATTNSATQAASPASETRLGRLAATVYSSTRIPVSAKVS